MSNPFATVPPIGEHFEPYKPHKIVAVRIFEFPHFWYAGILQDCGVENFDTVNISLRSSIRFERDGEYHSWSPGDSLIKIATDHGVHGTRDSTLEFKLNEAAKMIHHFFQDGNGILGIQYEKGFAHLSYRGVDVLSIQKLLEINPH